MNRIYRDDAYNIIDKFIEDGLVVDHIITDPPYNISRENNFSTMSSSNRKGLDFGEWDKGFDLYSWVGKYSKVIRDGGSIIVFTSYKFISHLVDTLEENDFVVKDILKWIKTNPMPRNTNRRYVQDTEFAIWAVKGKGKWVFNKPEDISYLRSEFKTPTVLGKERTKHPTQKSLKLMEEIIKIHTNKNELILDPFMGSATTGVAAIKNDRRFIGVELSEEFYEISKERIEDAKRSNIKFDI